MGVSVEQLEKELREDIAKAKEAGYRIHPGGYYYGPVFKKMAEGHKPPLCLLGAVAFSRSIPWSGYSPSEDQEACRVVGLSSLEMSCLEGGFCWPRSVDVSLHSPYFLLGKKLAGELSERR